MKYISRKKAIDNVRQVFSQTEEDAITLQEAARAWGGREAFSDEKNARWLGNKMTHWKYHALVQPVYKRRNSRRVFDKIQLTLEGKRAIGRVPTDGQQEFPSIAQGNRKLNNASLDTVMKLVAELRKANPDYEITFDVRLKEDKK